MACKQTAGLATGSACPPPVTGLKEGQIWLGNWSEITFAGGTGKVYTNITMAPTTKLYRFNVHNKGLDFTDEFGENETTGSRSWPTRLLFRILDRSGAAANTVETLGTELVVFVVGKNDKVMVGGSDSPMRLVENTAGFGADNFGESVVLGNDDGSKPFQLLVTDLAATIAKLVACETPAA